MDKGTHGTTYIGSPEIKGGKELSFLSVDVKCANNGVNQSSATSLLTPCYAKSLSCSIPTKKMGMGMLPGKGSGTGKTLSTQPGF